MDPEEAIGLKASLFFRKCYIYIYIYNIFVYIINYKYFIYLKNVNIILLIFT